MPAAVNAVNPVLEVDFDRDITELYSAITSEDWDGAFTAVRATPEEARTWVVRYEDARKKTVQWRFLPLHSACARQPPSNLVRALIKANADGAASEDDQGMWPLHYACGNQASSDVIRLLLKSYPEAAKMPDPNGMLPLHYLAKWGPSEAKIVDMVLATYPDAVNAVALEEIEGEEGRNVTPLELAEEGDYDDVDYVIDVIEQQTQEQPANEAEEQKVKKSSSQEGSADTSVTQEDPADDEETVQEGYQAPAPAPARKSAPKPASRVSAPKPAPAPARAPAPAPTPAPAPVAPPAPLASPPRQQRSTSVSRRPKSPAANLGNKTTIAKLVAQLESTREELAAARREVAELKEEKSSHEAYVKMCEEKIAKKDDECLEIVTQHEAECADLVAQKDKEVAEAEAEREEAVAAREAAEEMAKEKTDKLEAELAEINETHDVLLEKADDLTGHVIALTSSVESLTADRETVAVALAQMEEKAKEAAQMRQKKLRDLIDYEVEMTKATEDAVEEGGVQSALERQREELEAVAAILEAVNAKEEVASVESSCDDSDFGDSGCDEEE